MIKGSNFELDKDRQCKIAKKNVVHYKVYLFYIHDMYINVIKSRMSWLHQRFTNLVLMKKFANIFKPGSNKPYVT